MEAQRDAPDFSPPRAWCAALARPSAESARQPVPPAALGLLRAALTNATGVLGSAAYMATGTAALAIQMIAIGSDFIESDNCESFLKANQSCVINVGFRPFHDD